MRNLRPQPPARSAAEPLEPRRLLAVDVVVDYSYDANNFFDTADKRALLEQAADTAAKWFTDELLAITPSNGNTWEVTFDDPATDARRTVKNLSVGANQVILFAGGRDMTDALGRGGPGGYNATGSTAWLERVADRGQGDGGAEFAPWGGAITFDTNPDSPWHFGATTDGLSGRNDFLSVASHEVAHLLGFGTSRSWREFISAGRFEGPRSLTQYDGTGGVPVEPAPSQAHWAEGTRGAGQDVAMDPQLTVGTRRLLTPLDYAALDDIGWDMPPRAALDGGGVVDPAQSAHDFRVTYSHYAPLDASTLGPADATIVGPGGAPVTVTSFRIVTGAGDAWSRVVSYTVEPPGGSWDAADNGVYTVSVAADAVRSTTGEAVPGGTVGSFAVDIGDHPIPRLQPVAQPEEGAPTHSIPVEYIDAVAVDVASLDPGDITVQGPDGSVVPVIDVTLDVAAPAPRTVPAYVIAAPGGSWGPEDDGVYTVALRGGEVVDTAGNAAAAAMLGTFEVALGAVQFDARTPAVYTDPAGRPVRVMLRGPGSGRLRVGGATSADEVRVEVTGTTAASSLAIRGGPDTRVAAVVVRGPLRALVAPTVVVTGGVFVAESLGTLRLGRTGYDSFSTLVAVGKVKVGTLGGQFRTSGSIGSISARQIDDAVIFAGVRGDHGPALPDTPALFANPAASIGSIVTRSFTSSIAAAPVMGRMSLGQVFGVGQRPGVAADRIALLTARPTTEPPVRLRGLDAPGSGVVLTGFEVRVL